MARGECRKCAAQYENKGLLIAGYCKFCANEQLEQALKAENEKTCTWKRDDIDDMWETECGQGWTMLEGGLEDNKVKYCPYCGCKIIEQVLKGE